MKMIDLIAAATIAFLFTVLFFRLWNGIEEIHEDTLSRLQALSDASILVSTFRKETTDDDRPPVFPVPLTAKFRGITGIRQTVTTDSREKRGYILFFSLLGTEYTVRTGSIE